MRMRSVLAPPPEAVENPKAIAPLPLSDAPTIEPLTPLEPALASLPSKFIVPKTVLASVEVLVFSKRKVAPACVVFAMCKSSSGELVPIPTEPVPSIVTLSTNVPPDVLCAKPMFVP